MQGKYPARKQQCGVISPLGAFVSGKRSGGAVKSNMFETIPDFVQTSNVVYNRHTTLEVLLGCILPTPNVTGSEDFLR